MGEQQRWTAKRKAEVILQILRQTTTVIDVARQNDLTPSEVQEWVDTFLKGGEQSLNVQCWYSPDSPPAVRLLQPA